MNPPAQANRCLACQEPAVSRLADFGPQPVGHHFLESPDAHADTHPIVLGQCESCGLAQLIHPILPAKLVPRVDWIRYNEPEAHLDALVETLTQLPGLDRQARILGLTYKEDSSLRRFQERGFTQTSRLDMVSDLQIPNPCAGVEWVQHQLKPGLLPHLRARHGSPQLILVRHIIEHTHDTPGFLATFREWVDPKGYVVFELPDCARGFDLLDYTTFWEDHSLYFVESTFKATLERHGLEVAAFLRYPGPYEHCLVAVTRPRPTLRPPSLDFVPAERVRVRRFAENFTARREAIRAQLAAWRAQGPIALFGAGHQASTFLSLVGVPDLIDFVIDDHPRKAGRFMPGCALPIVTSEFARQSNANVWLSTVGAESERRILEKNQDFVRKGGRFVSIYPTQPGSLFTPIA